MIDFNRYDLTKAEDCIQFLVDSDEEVAKAEAWVNSSKFLLDSYEADEYLRCESGTAEDRKRLAKVSIRELGKHKDYENALTYYKTIRAKRETASLQIEIWRTKTSARKAGIL